MVFTAGAQQGPDTLWTHSYGFWEYETWCNCIRPTNDGGFIFTGVRQDYVNWLTEIVLVRIDQDGNTLWTRSFNGSYPYSEGYWVEQTADNGYILMAYSHEGAMPGDDQLLLIKTDAAGNNIWQNQYNIGNEMDWPSSACLTIDGGYLISGTSNVGNMTSEEKIFIIKADANGILQWTRYYYEELYYAYSGNVKPTPDGNYILTGFCKQTQMGDYDVCLIKVNNSGNIIWNVIYTIPYNQYGIYVDVCDDGGFVMAGFTNNHSYGEHDFYLLRTDSAGAISWEANFGGLDEDYAAECAETMDGGIIVTGLTYSYGAGEEDIYILKTNSLGQLLWQQTYGGVYGDRGSSVVQLGEEGYIAGGRSGLDAYIIRLEYEAPVEVTVNLTPAAPSIQIPAGGGSFDYNIAVENVSAAAQNFDVWSEIMLPNYGSVAIITVTGLNLAAGMSAERDRTQFVPAAAPMGNYTYYAYVGEYPWVVDYIDSFEFSKSSGELGAPLTPEGWISTGEPFDGKSAETQVYMPEELILEAPYPNPFNLTASLRFILPEAGYISLQLYDVQGREVLNLAEGWREAGAYEVTVNGDNLCSGIYWARLAQGNRSAAQKLIYLK